MARPVLLSLKVNFLAVQGLGARPVAWVFLFHGGFGGFECISHHSFLPVQVADGRGINQCTHLCCVCQPSCSHLAPNPVQAPLCICSDAVLALLQDQVENSCMKQRGSHLNEVGVAEAARRIWSTEDVNLLTIFHFFLAQVCHQSVALQGAHFSSSHQLRRTIGSYLGVQRPSHPLLFSCEGWANNE